MIEYLNLKQKQLSLLQHLKFGGEKFFNIKVNDELSPIGWHIIHCLYVECIWIRSKFFDDSDLVNKLKNIADGVKINPKNRGLNLPNYKYLYKLTKNEFIKNLILIQNVRNKKKQVTFYNF